MRQYLSAGKLFLIFAYDKCFFSELGSECLTPDLCVASRRPPAPQFAVEVLLPFWKNRVSADRHVREPVSLGGSSSSSCPDDPESLSVDDEAVSRSLPGSLNQGQASALVRGRARSTGHDCWIRTMQRCLTNTSNDKTTLMHSLMDTRSGEIVPGCESKR